MYNFPDKDRYNEVAAFVCRCVSEWCVENLDAGWDVDNWFCENNDGIQFDSVDQIVNCCANLIAEIRSPSGIFKTRDENFVWDAIISEAVESYCVPLWDGIIDETRPYSIDAIVESVLPICMAQEDPERSAELYFEDEYFRNPIEQITWDSDYQIFCATAEMWTDALSVVRPLAASRSLVGGEYFDDVYRTDVAKRTAAIIRRLAAKHAKQEAYVLPQEPAKTTPKHKPGLVYIIQSGDAFKIGHTTQDDPINRLSYYQTAHPGPLLMPLVIKCDDSKQTESKLHRQFASKRIRGEWFHLNSDDINAIKNQFNGAVQTFESIDCVFDAAIKTVRN